MPSLDLADDIIKNIRALIYKNTDGSRVFLLTQELDGAYTLPGGCKDIEDADIISTLKREIKEEVGLDIGSLTYQDAKISREYANLYTDTRSERHGKITRISLFLINITEEHRLQPSADIMSIVWYDAKTALDMLSGAHMKELLTEGLHVLEKTL